MGNLARESFWEVLCKPEAGQRPQLGQDIVLNEEDVLDLGVEARDEAELGFGAAVCLYGGQPEYSQRVGCRT